MNKFEFIDLKTPLKKYKKRINERIKRVLDHGQFIMGPEVKELEDKLSKYVGVKYCTTTASGTDALLISLMSLGIKRGDEVITTPFSFISTAEVIVLVGAKPVFVDIKLETCNIDPNLLESKITKRTKAIIAVSLFGQPAEFKDINYIAKKYNIPVIEDAAQSFGSNYRGKKSCNLSLIGCTSFFPSKPLGCFGDGGAIFTNNKKIYELTSKIRVHGAIKKYIHKHIGVQGRMDTLQCAVVLAKFTFFKKELLERKKIGEYYNKQFDKINLKRIEIIPDATSVYGQYTVFFKKRDKIKELLNNLNIPTAINYPLPIDFQEPYSNFSKKMNSNSVIASKNVLSLPMHPYLNQVDQKFIVNNIKKILNKTK